MPEPPRYHDPIALHAGLCRDCEFYKGEVCQMYEVPVVHNYTCDSWKRDPNLRGKLV